MARIVALSNESAAVVAVYAEQPEAGVAFALAFPEGELPRLVYWGRPMTHPETVVDAADALRPQRVSGALDYTPWPSVLPTHCPMNPPPWLRCMRSSPKPAWRLRWRSPKGNCRGLCTGAAP